MSEKLRTDLEGPNADDVVIEKRIYIDLPQITAHEGHLMGDVSIFTILTVPRLFSFALKLLTSSIVGTALF